MKSANLNFLEPSGQLQACNGTDYLSLQGSSGNCEKSVTLCILTVTLCIRTVMLRILIVMYVPFCGPVSSVGIATDYLLDGPGIEFLCGEIFRPSRPALGPTQPAVQWEPGLSRGKVRPGRAADHSPPSSAAVMKE